MFSPVRISTLDSFKVFSLSFFCEEFQDGSVEKIIFAGVLAGIYGI